MEGQLVTVNTNVQELKKEKEDQVKVNVALTQQMGTMGTRIEKLEERNDVVEKTMTTLKTQGEELTKQLSLSRSENREQNRQHNLLKQRMRMKYEKSQRELEASKQVVRMFQTSQHEGNEKDKSTH